MRECGQHRRHRTEAGDGIGRHLAKFTRQHRIGGPDERGAERDDKSRRIATLQRATEIAIEQHHDARESEQCAGDVMQREPLARQPR